MSHTPESSGAGPAGEPSPAGFVLPRTRPSDLIDGVIRRIGNAASWIWALLVVVIIYNVVQRYVFGIGAIWLEELQWHLYAIGFILGLSYAISWDRHVRIDVLFERWSLRTRAWIEFTGLMLLLIPFAVAILVGAVPFFLTAWRLDESSSAPGGLPNMWLLKSFIIWGFALILVAALARLMRCTALLFGWPKPVPARD